MKTTITKPTKYLKRHPSYELNLDAVLSVLSINENKEEIETKLMRSNNNVSFQIPMHFNCLFDYAATVKINLDIAASLGQEKLADKYMNELARLAIAKVI